MPSRLHSETHEEVGTRTRESVYNLFCNPCKEISTVLGTQSTHVKDFGIGVQSKEDQGASRLALPSSIPPLFIVFELFYNSVSWIELIITIEIDITCI